MDEISPLTQVRQAYEKLTRAELVLFLKIRKLPTSGATRDLAARLAHHDLHTYHFPTLRHSPEPPLAKAIPAAPRENIHTPDLPIEIIAAILEHLGDWELAQSVGIQTNIPQPGEWSWASRTDRAMLHSNVQLIRDADPCAQPPTKLGATVAVRMGYVNVLEYFLSSHHDTFLSIFKNDLIPIKASRYGRLDVLSWWKHGFEHHSHLVPPPASGSIAEALNAAARHGKIDSLDWWVKSGITLEYTEAVLEQASSRNQISVLDWWLRQNKLSGLALKVGRVMDMASTAGHVQVLEWWAASRLDLKYDQHAMQQASCHGKVDVLDWWLKSGLQVKYDADALIAATRHNRPEVLEWWDKSGLPIQYRMCDIEEALEEAIGGGGRARSWWESKGVDFNANDKEWMKSQNLN